MGGGIEALRGVEKIKDPLKDSGHLQSCLNLCDKIHRNDVEPCPHLCMKSRLLWHLNQQLYQQLEVVPLTYPDAFSGCPLGKGKRCDLFVEVSKAP